MKKSYAKPSARKRGSTKLVIVAAIHKGCSSSTARNKKG